MNKIIPYIIIISLIAFTVSTTFNYAYAVDNNCMINPVHILLVKIPLGCIEDRLDTLENASSGDLTICDNVGTGNPLHKSGTNCSAFSLIAGSGITIANTTDDYTISATGGSESTICDNVGTGNPLHKSGTNCSAFSLIAGSGITIANTTDDYTISASGGSNHNLLSATHSDTVTQTVSRGSLIYGDITPLWNELLIGSASQYLRSNGTDASWSFPNVVTKTSTTTLTLNEDIILCSTAGSFTLNLPTASGITGKIYVIKKITDNINNCTLDPSGAETIDGLATIRIDVFNSGIAIISDGTNWKIIYDNRYVGQIVGQVWESLVKTNIGTAYIDIYTATFHEENMLVLDCRYITEVRIFYLWDYVGVGTQTLRWVDTSNNGNVLFETASLSDSDYGDSGWFIKPDWCISATVAIEEQGKSTTGTDDPIAKGYKIMVR